MREIEVESWGLEKMVKAAGCCNHISRWQWYVPIWGGVLSPGPNESGGVVFGALATYGLGCGLRDNNDKNKK